VEWGGPQQFVPFGSDDRGLWRGFQAPRADLDERLLTLARGLGAEVLRGRTARAVILRDGRVVGVDTGRGELYAQYTVDASGSTHWLARQMKIPIETHSPKLAARFGYFETAPADGDRLPRIRADETGWTWIADIGLGRYLWTRVSEQELPEDWAPRDWGGSTGKSRGADVTWRRAIRPAGPGWFLAGDSAAVLDPSSSHGVLKAVMSGMLAAYYAAAMLRGEARADQVSEVYSHWLEAWFRHDVSHLANSYRLAGLFGF
jgi:flavin-dependent dehydrogenase